MAKRAFRPYEPEQPLPLPPDLRQWLPADHLVYLLSDLVDQVDLTPILAVYEQGDGGGNPPYHPVLLTKLLLYAYCQGVVSSRVIARKTYEEVACRVLTADQHPDFRTSSDFRERHLPALTDLFIQVVRLAGRLGLVKLEQVAQDGSTILAKAAKHHAMSYRRRQQAEARLSAELQALLEAARQVDAAEDAAHGPEQTGDELPPDLSGEIARRERRLVTIRTAKAALEAEAQAAAAAIRAADAAERQRRAAAGEPKKPGNVPAPKADPAADAQRHCTDPDSRIMKHADQAFVQAYHGQAAVDAGGAQMIVGCLLTNQRADTPQVAPMVEQVPAATGQLPGEWRADAGCFSAATIATIAQAGGSASMPPDRQAHPTQPLPAPVTHILAAAGLGDPAAEVRDEHVVKAALRARLQTEAGRAAYGQRKQTVEPLFGQLQERRGVRRFLLRGLAQVQGDWTRWCVTHNLRTIVQALQTRPEVRQRLARLELAGTAG